MAGGGKERTLEETPTWAVAVVCFVLLGVSILIEHAIHLIGHWLQKKNKRALYEALEKIKAELMLLGFISLLLTVLQGPISDICISEKVGSSWHPCDLNKSDKKPSTGKCEDRGQVPLVSSYGIHQLHIFIFVLAVFHVLYCIITWFLGRIKMRKWRAWEDETKTIEYQYSHDPERFRFARDTSFGRRHLTFWSGSPILLWTMCFFRQFYKSVDKVDYLTLRHGFIMAHLAPSNETKFDFQKYIKKSLEEDFKVVVGISPPIWMFAVLFLLTNTHGWFSYLWLPFIPLIVLLLVGAKLQVIITKMGLRIQDRGDVVKGAPVVQPGDDLFWFGRPRLILFLINFVLFQNAFQLAFFAWSTYEFGVQSCYHKRIEDIIIRVTMGVLIEFLCGYVTLPLYAIVTQMGTTMKPTIFNDRVAMALKNWHRTARKQTKHGGKSGSTTPLTSRPGTPSHGMSPVHLLQNYRQMDSSQTSPRHSNFDTDHWDINNEQDMSRHRNHDGIIDQLHNQDQQTTVNPHEFAIVPVPPLEQGSTSASASASSSSMGQLQLSVPIVPPRPIRTQHEINMSSSDFSFEKRG